MPDDRPRYRLTFRGLPDDVPVEHRLRRLLKFARRACRLVCEWAEELPPERPDPAPPPKENGP